MKKLIIVGTGETALLAYDYFINDSPYEIEAFAVEKEYLRDLTLFELPVVAFEQMEKSYPPTRFDAFAAISYTKLNRLRTRLFLETKKKGYQLQSYVSSRAFVGRNVKIGENCFILENNVLQYGTTIENNVVLWSGNHIGHRATIGENSYVSSHVAISGFCHVGRNCIFGVNSALANNITVADDCFIGMGAVVNRDTEKGKVYLGNPAQAHKHSAYTLQGIKPEET